MFTKTARYYDALYHFKDYAAACEQLRELINQYVPDAKSLLDVGCGTGKHLEHTSKYYQAQGLDLDSELLKVAKQRCPGTVFNQGDMTNFELHSRFDVVVCLFSSIGYVQTRENLNKAVKCMANHLNTNGLLLIEPWITPENYWVDKLTSNYVDQPDLKIAWMYTSKREGLTSVFDIHYLVGDLEGVRTFTETHIMGLWTHDEYCQAFTEAGINPIYDPKGLFGRGMYYGIKS